MSDTTTPQDEALVRQLRAWADDLAEQVPPVAAPTGERGGPGRARLLAVAAAVVVVLGLAAVVAVRAGGGGDDVMAGATTTTIPDVPLAGQRWYLLTIEEDGDSVDLPADITPSVTIGPCASESDCAGGDAVTGYDGCNSFSGEAEIGPERIVVDEVISTQMGCIGGRGRLAELVNRLIRDELGYVVEGDRLTLRADGVVATFVAGDGPYPALADGATAFTVPDLPAGHRLSWRRVDGGAIELRVDMIDMIVPEDLTVELDAARGEMAAVTRPGRRPTVVAGLVDARATRVTFDRQEGGDPTAETVALAGVDDVRAFLIVVPGVSGPWDLTATDADGGTVATYDPPR